MTEKAQNVAIARALRWSISDHGWGFARGGTGWPSFIPHYTRSLDAMHEVEKTLDASQRASYYRHLYALRRHGMSLTHQIWWPVIHATAAQRAEAFLKTLGLWVV